MFFLIQILQTAVAARDFAQILCGYCPFPFWNSGFSVAFFHQLLETIMKKLMISVFFGLLLAGCNSDFANFFADASETPAPVDSLVDASVDASQIPEIADAPTVNSPSSPKLVPLKPSAEYVQSVLDRFSAENWYAEFDRKYLQNADLKAQFWISDQEATLVIVSPDAGDSLILAPARYSEPITWGGISVSGCNVAQAPQNNQIVKTCFNLAGRDFSKIQFGGEYSLLLFQVEIPVPS